MNTTDTRLAEAQRRLESIQTKLSAVRRQLQQCREKLGADFAAVADGAEVPAAPQRELADLVAEEMTLASMEGAALKAVSAGQGVAFARGIAKNAQQMQRLLQRHRELSAATDQALDALAIAGTDMRENARQILGTFRALRARNTLTAKGVVSMDTAGLVAGNQLQWLIEGGLGYVARWWRAERRAPFLPNAIGAIAAYEADFSELMGLDAIEPAVLSAARADMANDGDLLQIDGPAADVAAEVDLDMYADLDDGNSPR